MSTTIWSGLVSGRIRYDLTYDASRPDSYGSKVNITFHLHTYRDKKIYVVIFINIIYCLAVAGASLPLPRLFHAVDA